MSWLCYSCGYENEINSESQTYVCLCCGEPAPESVITKTHKKIDSYRYKKEKEAQLEKLRKRQQLRQQRVAHIVTDITSAIKSILLIATSMIVVMVVASFVWIAASFHSKVMTLAVWSTQMLSNINSIYPERYAGVLNNNLTEIDLNDKTLVPIQVAGQQIASLMTEHFSSISGNVAIKNEIGTGNYLHNTSSNIQQWRETVFSHNNHLSNNALLISESMGDYLKKVREQPQIIGQHITSSRSNMELNWSIFSSRVKSNVQRLVDTITIREGGTDD